MKYFSERLHNPYRGIANVVDTGQADAVSRDGLNWVLYVRGEVEEELLIDGEVHAVMMPDTKYGCWSEKQGLQRAPLRAVRDTRVEYEGGRLLATLINCAAEVPFPLQDHYEHWLLDAAGEPLALLGSVTVREEIRFEEGQFWNIGGRARREFCRAHSPHGRQAADMLESLINEAAGGQPCTRWFKRWPDGSGQVLECLEDGMQVLTEIWPAAAFPDLLLRTEWADPQMQALCDDFIQWQAPYLLQLQDLQPDMREVLEIAAQQRALLLEDCHRLIPEWCDRGRLKAALVEAELRRCTVPLAVEEQDNSLQPFFNE